MGFNTTVIVMNDAAHIIAQDHQFGKRLAQAITECSLYNNIDVAACIYDEDGDASVTYGNAATVVETHHADRNAIVAVGGNYATVLGYTFGHHHKPENAEEILRQLADKLGFSLRRKPKVKK